jgi:hypothetical protein
VVWQEWTGDRPPYADIVRIRRRLVPASEPLGSSLRKSGEGAPANGPEVQGGYANDLRDDALEGIGI